MIKRVCVILFMLVISLSTTSCLLDPALPDTTPSPTAEINQNPVGTSLPPEATEAAPEVPAEPASIAKIVSDSGTFAYLDPDGKVYIWGNLASCVPADLPPMIDIAVGCNHVVALDENGKLYGWGNPEHGEIDFPDDLPKIIAIAAKGYQTTALSEDGKVYKWGNANAGDQSYVPKDMGEVIKVANGTYFTAAIDKDGKIYAWGICNSDPPICSDPAMLAPLAYDLVVLGEDGMVYGDVGHSNLSIRYKEQPELGKIEKLFSGDSNLAAVDENGKLTVWGEYIVFDNGQSFVNVPTNLPKVVYVAFTYSTIACLCEDGKVYQWGASGYQVPDEINGFKDMAPVFESAETEEVSAHMDVYSIDEFLNAIQLECKDITIKDSITISGDSLSISGDTTVTIDPGVVFSVEMMNFNVSGNIINHGTISVNGHGRILLRNELPEIGDIQAINGGEIIFYSGVIELTEIIRILDVDSIYTSIAIVSGSEFDLVIDEDFTIPEGKSLWVNAYGTVVINEGVTLTINGMLEVHNEPVNNGTIIGEVTGYY